jgi:type IV secretory pathway TrbF-like protein
MPKPDMVALGKTELAAEYDALDAEKQKQVVAFIASMTPDPVLTAAEVAAGYDALPDNAKERISRIVRRHES